MQIKASDITRIGGFKSFGHIEIQANKKCLFIRSEELLKILQQLDITFDVEPLKGRSKNAKISQRGLSNLERAPDKFKLVMVRSDDAQEISNTGE